MEQDQTAASVLGTDGSVYEPGLRLFVRGFLDVNLHPALFEGFI